MAVAIPLLKQVISIVGALFFSMLGVILPPVMQTVFTWDSIGSFVVIKNFILVVVGFFAMVSGCTVSIQEIIEIQSGIHDE